MCRIDGAGQAAGPVYLNYRHQVEPKQSKVGKVVLRQLLTKQVGVHAPQTSKAVLGNTRTPEIGQFDLLSSADHHILDLPFTVDKDPDLAIGLL